VDAGRPTHAGLTPSPPDGNAVAGVLPRAGSGIDSDQPDQPNRPRHWSLWSAIVSAGRTTVFPGPGINRVVPDAGEYTVDVTLPTAVPWELRLRQW